MSSVKNEYEVRQWAVEKALSIFGLTGYIKTTEDVINVAAKLEAYVQKGSSNE